MTGMCSDSHSQFSIRAFPSPLHGALLPYVSPLTVTSPESAVAFSFPAFFCTGQRQDLPEAFLDLLAGSQLYSAQDVCGLLEMQPPALTVPSTALVSAVYSGPGPGPARAALLLSRLGACRVRNWMQCRAGELGPCHLFYLLSGILQGPWP